MNAQFGSRLEGLSLETTPCFPRLFQAIPPQVSQVNNTKRGLYVYET